MRHALLSVLAVVAAVELSSMQSGGKVIVKAGPDPGLPFSPAVKAGGLIYVSGTLATDAQGNIAGEDVRAQTRVVLDRIGGVLGAAGARLADVASVQVYLKRAEDFAAMNEEYRKYFPDAPPARTTVVCDLLRGGLVEMSAVAVDKGTERRVVHPEGWQKSPNPYNYAVRAGDTLFLSGLVARDPRTNARIEGDMAAQTSAVLKNAEEILRAGGLGFEHVVSARVFITDGKAFQAMNGAYRPRFPKDPPARATVIAGLTAPDLLVEITLTASAAPRRAIAGTGTPNPNLSPAILAGQRLYLSGMLGVTDATRGDARAQTRETLARLGRTLTDAGFSWDQVVDGVVYLPSLADYAAMNEGYREIFKEAFPARATIGAGLVADGGLVEIMLTAVKP
jgi:enamine deaminase RidA (YjgF/YER057c/UK114 family)